MLPKVLKHIAVNQCVDGPNRIASFLANSNAVGSIILLFFWLLCTFSLSLCCKAGASISEFGWNKSALCFPNTC